MPLFPAVLTTTLALLLTAPAAATAATLPAAPDRAAPALATDAAATGTVGRSTPALATGTPGRGTPGPAEVERLLRSQWEKLEAVVEQYNRVRDDIKITQSRSAAVAARMRPLESAVRLREARVGSLAANAYRAGGVAGASTMLTATSPEQFADRLLVVRTLAGQQSRAIAGLRRARAGYESVRAELDALAASQRGLRERLATSKRHIEARIRALERLAGDREGRRRHRIRDGYVPTYAPGPAGAAVRFAYRQLGKPYQWGGSGPSGYDCSGLTSAAWRAGGAGLPHNAARQWHSVAPISRAELRQGDLVFYYQDIHHVALYVGAGRVIHAPNHGETIRVDPMRYAPIYGYGRPS